MVRVYVEETLLQDEPQGIRDLTEVIEWDEGLHGIVIKYNEITLTFWGDGAKKITQLIRQYGYDYRVSVSIEISQQGYIDTIKTFFFLTDIQYDATENTYEVDLEDTNFGAYIKSGQKEKVNVQAQKTKNGETAVNNGTVDITLFTPSTGVNIATDAKCYRIDHILELIISYLSDNNMTFSNGYDFPSVGIAVTKHYFINTANIASASTPDNNISFTDVMDFLYKVFNVNFWIDLTSNPAVFRISAFNDMMEDAGQIHFTQVRGLKLTFDQDRMWSSVKLGTKNAIIDRTEAIYQLRYAPLVNFSEEVINTRSTSMMDEQLNLMPDNWTMDTNKIEQMLVESLTSGSWDESNVVFVYGFGGNADKGQYGTSGTHRLYNEDLLNKNVLARHNVPTSLVNELGTDTDSFSAYLTSDDAYPFNLTPIIFNTEDTDVGGNYNPATGIYTVPATGVYRFHAQIHIEVASLQTPSAGILQNGIDVDINFQRNGSNVSTTSAKAYGITDSVNKKFHIINAYYESMLDAGDTIEVDISQTFIFTTGTGTNSASLKGMYNYTDDDGRLTQGGTMFRTVFVWNSGGEVAEQNTLDYPAVLYDFKYPISLKQWKSLRERPIQGITVDTNGRNQSVAWIKRIQRNWITGESDITLFTKLSENNI